MLKTTPGSHLALAAAALLSCLSACRRTPTSATGPVGRLELKPAAAARGNLVAEIVVSNFDRSLASVAAVAKKLGVPMNEADMSRMLVARSGAPEGLVESIDRSKPAAAAVILVPKKDADAGAEREAAEPVIALALKATDQAGFDAFVSRAGKVVERSGDAVKIHPGDAGGSSAVWLLSRDGVVCLAEAVDRLVAGCALAMEARKAGTQDLRVTLSPEGMARASGTTLKAALAKARTEMATQLAAEQAKAPAAGKNANLQAQTAKLGEAIIGWFLDAVGDTTEGRIGLTLDPAKGLATTFEAVPRAGSPLATTVASRHPYSVDPALAGGAPGAVWAMGDMTLTRAMFQSMRGPLLELIEPEAERARASAAVDALFEALSGPSSGRFSFEGPKMAVAYDVIYTVKPGTDGKKLTADLESLVKAPWVARFMEGIFQGLVKVKVSTKREGDALVTQMVADTKKLPAEMKAQMKALPLFDGKPIESRTMVAGQKLIVTIGAGSKARTAALVSGSGAPAAADLATALAESKGEDAVYYADLAAMLRPMFALVATGALDQSPGGMQATMMANALGGALQNSQMATWGSYRGGETATVTWRIPITTFESVGRIAAMMMGGR